MSQELPRDADVVVIGTGAFGLSVTTQLARLGVRRVVALDRFEIASQTSPRAAGLFKLVQADELRTRLARLAVDTVRNFEVEFGVPVPFIHSGSLMIARTDRHSRLIEEEVAAAQRWGVEVELISPQEASRLAPYVEPEEIRQAAYVPGDIYIEEPVSLLEAYHTAAARLGATVVGGVPVTGIVVRNGAVHAVETPLGHIRTETVVDAAGAWVRQVSQWAGADFAVLPMRHQLAITHPIPGIEATYPITRVFDAAVYVRPCRGGLLWGGFESDPLPLDPANRGQDFRIEHVPLEFGVLECFAQLVCGVIPSLHDAPVQEHRGGLFTMTPDGCFVAGPVPEVRGLWVLSGCNGSGFSFSPALGRLLAEWIVTGAPSINLSPLAPGRFVGPIDAGALVEAAVWQYTHYYEPLES